MRRIATGRRVGWRQRPPEWPPEWNLKAIAPMSGSSVRDIQAAIDKMQSSIAQYALPFVFDSLDSSVEDEIRQQLDIAASRRR